MIEVNNIDEMIEKFPMYPNLTLPKDVYFKVHDAYQSLLIYRDFNNDADGFPEEGRVYFIEDEVALSRYLQNIFFSEKKKARVFRSIGEAIDFNKEPKIFFIDLSSIDKHENIVKLNEKYPNSKIVLMSGVAEYVENFLRELYYFKRGLQIDYIFNRNYTTIKKKIEDIIKKKNL